MLVNGVQLLDAGPSSGTFTVVLPQASVKWDPSGLSYITTMAAPPSMLREYYTAKAASRSTMAGPKLTASIQNHEPSQLSTGALAGIGVGVLVAVLLALLAGLLIVRKKRRRRQSQSDDPPPSDDERPYLDRKAELATIEIQKLSGDSSMKHCGEHRRELEAHEVKELDAGSLPQETTAHQEYEKRTANSDGEPISPVSATWSGAGPVQSDSDDDVPGRRT